MKSSGEDTKVPTSDSKSDIATLDTRESFPYGLKKILVSDTRGQKSSTDGGRNKGKGLTPLPPELRRREDRFSCLRKEGLGMVIVSGLTASFAVGDIRRIGAKGKNECDGDREEFKEGRIGKYT